MISTLAILLAALLPSAIAAHADEDFDPAKVDVVDAIECRLDAPSYNGFAFALDDDEHQLAKKRGWVRIKTPNPFLNEYQLPAAITVAGKFSTRRIGFSSKGVVAILDLPDPAPLARELGIRNAADPAALIEGMGGAGKLSADDLRAMTGSGKFLGEKVVTDRTEPPAAGESFGTHSIIARNVSTVTSHPGKTLYGCSYQIEIIGKDGRPI